MSPILIKGLMIAGGLGVGGVGAWQIHEHTRPRTLQQKLEREGLIFISFTDENKLSEWTTRAQKHKSDSVSNGNPVKFSSLSTTASDSGNNGEGKALRTKCKEVAERELGQDDEINNLQRLRNWCVTSPSITLPSAGVGG